MNEYQAEALLAHRISFDVRRGNTYETLAGPNSTPYRQVQLPIAKLDARQITQLTIIDA